MVVHSDRDDFLGFVLTNNVLIQEFFDLPGLHELEVWREACLRFTLLLLLKDLARLCDAFVTNMGMYARDHQIHILLTSAAKRARYFCHNLILVRSAVS